MTIRPECADDIPEASGTFNKGTAVANEEHYENAPSDTLSNGVSSIQQ